jgi:hypothetical protein
MGFKVEEGQVGGEKEDGGGGKRERERERERVRWSFSSLLVGHITKILYGVLMPATPIGYFCRARTRSAGLIIGSTG